MRHSPIKQSLKNIHITAWYNNVDINLVHFWQNARDIRKWNYFYIFVKNVHVYYSVTIE